MFRTRLLAGAIGLAALLALVPTVRADYCLTSVANPTYVLVGRGFIIPGKGKCKPWVGFTAQAGFNSPTSGTACRATDGSHLGLTLTTSFPEAQGASAGFVEIDSITLALPAQTGTSNSTHFSSGGTPSALVFDVTGQVCPSKIPVPAVRDGASESGSIGGGKPG